MKLDPEIGHASGASAKSAQRVAMRRRNLRVPLGLLVFLGYTFLAVLLLRRIWADPGSRMPGGEGDPYAYAWALSWFRFALVHHHNPLVTTWLNAPHGANLMWASPPMPLLLMTPVTAAFGPIVSYDVLTTLAFALSAWTMWLAVRGITGSEAGAVISGLFYGFTPFMVAHGGSQAALALAVFPPLALLLGYDIVVRRRWSARRAGLLLGCFVAAQLMTMPETVITTGLSGAVGVAVLAIGRRHEITYDRMRHVLLAVTWAAGTAVALAAPALYVMLAGPQRIRAGMIHVPDVFVSDLASFVIPEDYMLVHSDATHRVVDGFTGLPIESNGYVGIPLLVVLVFAVIRFRRRWAICVAAIAALATAVLSLGPELHVLGTRTGIWLPEALLSRLPLMQNLLPSRFALEVNAWIAVLLGLTVADVMRHRRRSCTAIIAVLLGVSAVALMPAGAFTPAVVSVPSFFTSSILSRIPDGSVALVAPYTVTGDADRSQLWQAAADFRFKMPEGYVLTPYLNSGTPVIGPAPTELGVLLSDLQTTGRLPHLSATAIVGTRQQLRSWGVQTVIVGPMRNRDTMTTFLTQVLGVPGEEIGGVTIWWEVPKA